MKISILTNPSIIGEQPPNYSASGSWVRRLTKVVDLEFRIIFVFSESRKQREEEGPSAQSIRSTPI